MEFYFTFIKTGPATTGATRPRLPALVTIYSLQESYSPESCHEPFHLEDGITTSNSLICHEWQGILMLLI